MALVKPKKYLGQHFLKDESICKDIALIYSKNNESNILLEIGPGMGALTKHLVKNEEIELFCIEYDIESVNFLNENLNLNKDHIIYGDFLKLDLDKLFEYKTFGVIGNFPYNISSQILFKCLNHREQINLVIGMFQKEVANRIISDYNCSDYGRLSILANWKLNIKKIMDVKPNSFLPKPRIESSLLFFSIKKNFFRIKSPLNLEKITRIFFNHRRKMIKKPFNQIFPGKNDLLSKLNISLNLRPQNLDFETYYKLTEEYEKLRS